MRPSLVIALVLPAIVANPVDLTAQSPDPDARLHVEQWLDWERVEDPQISPDGSRVVYTRGWIDRMADRWESSLWIVDIDGSRNRALRDGSSPRWSPEGTRIAFLAPDENGASQIFVRWMDAEGAVSQVTRLESSPADLAWSPDGRMIAFTAEVPAEQEDPDAWRIDLPRPEGASWTPSPRIVESLVFRRDRVGFVDEAYRQVFVVPAEGGTPRPLTSGNFDHGAPAWTPDGAAVLLSGLRREDAGYHWQESEVYRVDLSGDVTQLTNRRGPDRNPVPSPDGRHIAYVGYDTTGMDYIESALYVMQADGSNPRALTANMDRSPGALFWSPDSRGIYFNVRADGYENVFHASLAGDVREVTTGNQLVALTGVAGNRVAVGTRQDAHAPPDVVAVPLDAPDGMTRLTEVNDDVLAGTTLGEVEEIWYESFDGLRIQGWIITPPDFDAARRYPMMLVIHGGPHSMYHGGFNFGWQEHAANGYVVLYTNPRGSSGYGSEFGNAIQYDYPGDDYHDLMAGVDHVLARGYIDEENLFVYGCSGGGVLTSWVVGHTDRFRAASANCPVINWLSFPGQVDGNYLRWYADFEHFPWEDPTEHLRRSPLMYVGNVTTPTMLMTGVLDLRTPISQTEQFYQALKAQNKPTAMIRFEGEWHGTSRKPSNFMRTQLYLRKWFERWGTHDDEVTRPATSDSR